MALTKENEEYLVGMIKDVCGSIVAETVHENMASFRESMEKTQQQDPQYPAWVTELLSRSDIPDSPDELIKQGGIQEKLDSSESVQRMIKAIAAGKGDPVRSADWYHRTYGDDVICKALAATDATAGGFIVPEEMAMDVIELLRPASRFRGMNPQIVTMDSGVMRLPKITGGAAGSYIAENQNMTATEQTFGQVVANAKKLAALVPVSNDLIRRRGDSNTIVRDDLVAALAQASDLAFIRSDGTSGEPKGMRFWAQAANILTVNATVNTENVLADLGTAIQTLMDGNVRMLRVGWMFSPRTWRALLTATASTGQMVLRDEMQAGRLFGFPFSISTQIPDNLAVTGTNESEIYLADFADLVIAETVGLILDASTEAAYHDGSNVVAAFSLDQTVVRAIMEHDLVARHEESIVVLSDVDWTAITT